MPQTIAARIEADIEAQILSGTWPPGSRLPYEHVMMEQYRCSRMTVSKVLTGMSARGLIVRRRRAGSFVAIPNADRAVLQIEDFAQQALHSGQSYRHAIHHRSLRALRRGELTALGLATSGQVLEVHCRHELDGIPVAWEERLILVDAVPAIIDEMFLSIPPGTWLLQHVPWNKAEHVISAVNASPQQARQLSIEEGAACLELHRRTWLLGSLVTDVSLTYPGSRYRFSGCFSPGGPA